MAEKFFIGPNFRDRIKETIRVVQAMPEHVSGVAGPVSLQEINQPHKTFRICTFTGAWGIDQQKVVTFRNVTATPNTVMAYNLFANITAATTGSRPCAIGKDGTAWYLIATRC
jgi:hypothetical protein